MFLKASKYRNIVQTHQGIIIQYESFREENIIYELKSNKNE